MADGVAAAGAMFHITLAPFVIPLFGTLAMAWMTIASQAIICTGLVFTLRHHGLVPSLM